MKSFDGTSFAYSGEPIFAIRFISTSTVPSEVMRNAAAFVPSARLCAFVVEIRNCELLVSAVKERILEGLSVDLNRNDPVLDVRLRKDARDAIPPALTMDRSVASVIYMGFKNRLAIS